MLPAVKALQKNSRVTPAIDMQDGFPRSVRVRVPVAGNTPVERARAYLAAYAPLYSQTDPDFALGVRKVQNPVKGVAVVRFYEEYRGVPAHGAELVVFLKANEAYGTVGSLLPAARTDTLPAVHKSQAENLGRQVLAQPNAQLIGETHLVISTHPSSPRASARPTSRGASRGAATSRLNCSSTPTAGKLLAKNGLARKGTFDEYDLDLEDAENDSSSQNSSCYYWSDETEIGDAAGIIGAYAADADANQAWNFMRSTYQYYYTVFGRESYDGDGEEIGLYVYAKNGAGWIAQWVPRLRADFRPGASC